MSRAFSLKATGIALALWWGCFMLSTPCVAEDSHRVAISKQEGKLRIEIDGQLFSEYVHQDTPRPYLYPLIGPGGQALTRNWPMKNALDEEHDHPHHKSFWFTHGAVNGIDFWADGPDKGKIVHRKFTNIESGRCQGIIESENTWQAPDGKVVATDQRILRIIPRNKVRLVDYEITLNASEGDLILGDTKEGSMGIRLAETMRLKGKVGKGHIVNSEGAQDGETWGKRANWCDYYGPVDGVTVGIAAMDHPSNPRHPTWWHVRDYGLFAANPFGIHDFEKKPVGTGDMKVIAGKNITFKYRFVLHQGNTLDAGIAELWKEYSQSK